MPEADEALEPRLEEQAREVADRARRDGRQACFTIASTASRALETWGLQSVRETPSTVSGTLLVTDDAQARRAARVLDGRVDLLLVDAESKREQPMHLAEAVREVATRSRVLPVRPNEATVRALDTLVALERPALEREVVAVVGAGRIGAKAGLALAERGARVVLVRRDFVRMARIVAGLRELLPGHLRDRLEAAEAIDDLRPDVLIGATPGVPAIGCGLIESLPGDGLVVDAGSGTLSAEALELAQERGLRVLGLYVRPAWAGEVETVLATQDLLAGGVGRGLHAGVPIVSGGYIGQRGDVLVDRVDRPARLLGVVDGRGDTLPESAWEPEHRRRWSLLHDSLGADLGEPGRGAR